ncbi:MAG: HGxxPAAW family protein [Nocardioidaceae bacterium]
MSAHHGNTPAAWTLVTIVLVGFVVGGVGVILEQMAVLWVGVGIGAVGLVVGLIMRRMGLGVEPARD